MGRGAIAIALSPSPEFLQSVLSPLVMNDISPVGRATVAAMMACGLSFTAIATPSLAISAAPSPLILAPHLAQTEDDSPPEAAPDLLGQVWQLQGIYYNDADDIRPDQPERYTLEFLEDGAVAIGADCNRVTGQYAVTGDRLTLEPGASTEAACPPDSIAADFVFALRGAAAYTRQPDGSLTITMIRNLGTIVLEPLGGLNTDGPEPDTPAALILDVGREHICTLVRTLPNAENADALVETLGTTRNEVASNLEILRTRMERLNAEGRGWPTVLGSGTAPENRLEPWLIAALRIACED